MLDDVILNLQIASKNVIKKGYTFSYIYFYALNFEQSIVQSSTPDLIKGNVQHEEADHHLSGPIVKVSTLI